MLTGAVVRVVVRVVAAGTRWVGVCRCVVVRLRTVVVSARRWDTCVVLIRPGKALLVVMGDLADTVALEGARTGTNAAEVLPRKFCAFSCRASSPVLTLRFDSVLRLTFNGCVSGRSRKRMLPPSFAATLGDVRLFSATP